MKIMLTARRNSSRIIAAADCAFFGGVTVYCGPKGMVGAPDRLYRNEGERFVDATESSGVSAANRYYGLGVIPEDFDLDGDSDLFVANDETPNVLFRNEGNGTFTDVAVMGGVAYNEDGDEEAGMGVAVGDYDRDGDPDLYVTHFFQESNTLYDNDGRGTFTDVTARSGLGGPTLSRLGWGTGFFDWDHDGDLDLFVANGHVYPHVDDVESGSSYRQRNQLFENLGSGDFRDVSAFAGPGMEVEKVSRGAAFGDYNNDGDGDGDIFIVNLNDTPTLLRSGGDEEKGSWLAVQVVASTCNRDGTVRAWGCAQGGRPNGGRLTERPVTWHTTTCVPTSGSGRVVWSTQCSCTGRTGALIQSEMCRWGDYW